MAQARRERPIDWVAALMALAISLVLAYAAWQALTPARPGIPRLGTRAPVLRLVDPTDGAAVTVRLDGRIAWVTFWSTASPTAAIDLARLDRLWGEFAGERRFLGVAATPEPNLASARAGLSAARKAGRPVYIAPAESLRVYGADRLPLHWLVDRQGNVVAAATGWDDATLERLRRRTRAALNAWEQEEPLPALFAHHATPPRTHQNAPIEKLKY